MSQKEKPKRKNLSPDELLQEARLLYPENEAFVRGESKALHPKMTIFANIRHRKYKISANRIQDIVLGIIAIGISVSGVIFTAGVAMSFDEISTMIIIGIPVLFFGGLTVFFSYILWKMLTFSERLLEDDYINLVKHGRLIFGEGVSVNQKTRSIGFMIYPPNADRGKYAYWHLDEEISLEKGDKVIILHLDNELSIVL